MKPLNVGDMIFIRRPTRRYVSARVLALHDDYVYVFIFGRFTFISRKFVLTESKVKELKERFTRGHSTEDDEC